MITFFPFDNSNLNDYQEGMDYTVRDLGRKKEYVVLSKTLKEDIEWYCEKETYMGEDIFSIVDTIEINNCIIKLGEGFMESSEIYEEFKKFSGNQEEITKFYYALFEEEDYQFWDIQRDNPEFLAYDYDSIEGIDHIIADLDLENKTDDKSLNFLFRLQGRKHYFYYHSEEGKKEREERRKELEDIKFLEGFVSLADLTENLEKEIMKLEEEVDKFYYLLQEIAELHLNSQSDNYDESVRLAREKFPFDRESRLAFIYRVDYKEATGFFRRELEKLGKIKSLLLGNNNHFSAFDKLKSKEKNKEDLLLIMNRVIIRNFLITDIDKIDSKRNKVISYLWRQRKLDNDLVISLVEDFYFECLDSEKETFHKVSRFIHENCGWEENSKDLEKILLSAHPDVLDLLRKKNKNYVKECKDNYFVNLTKVLFLEFIEELQSQQAWNSYRDHLQSEQQTEHDYYDAWIKESIRLEQERIKKQAEEKKDEGYYSQEEDNSNDDNQKEQNPPPPPLKDQPALPEKEPNLDIINQIKAQISLFLKNHNFKTSDLPSEFHDWETKISQMKTISEIEEFQKRMEREITKQLALRTSLSKEKNKQKPFPLWFWLVSGVMIVGWVFWMRQIWRGKKISKKIK